MRRWLSLLLATLLLAALPVAVAEEDVHANWYEVFVYSYQDSDGDGIGDLRGLQARLDYIADMGFDGLWLMPIMPSPSYHKYDVTDYMSVDPLYGTVEDLKALAEACHARGIRLIIDLPINHTAYDHPWFQAAAAALREGREEDPYVGYYNFSRDAGMKMVPLGDTGWYYEEQFSGGGMPDLNLDNPAVLEELRAIMAFWLQECGVDGFRLDAVTSYFAGSTAQNVAFLARLKAMAEELKPGSYLVGEAWTGLTEIARYYESGVDSFFLFPASQAEGYIAKTLLARNNPAAKMAGYLEQLDKALPDALLAPFLSNHDTGRAVAALQARSALPRLKFAHGLVNMLGGNTFTYYGEEIGMAGSGEDPNKRTAMYWNDEDMTAQPPGVTKAEYPYPCVDEQMADPGSLLNYIRAVNALKRQAPAIARGARETLYQDGELMLWARTYEDETAYIALNFSPSGTRELPLPEGGAYAVLGDLETGEEACALSEDGLTLTLPPYAIVVLTSR